MFTLPDNIYHRVFDLTFTETTHKYVPRDENFPIEEGIKNRNSLIQSANAKEVTLTKQVHGNEIYYAKNGSVIGKEPIADGCFTDIPGVLLAIQTADCVPVLLYSGNGDAIGAVHAGWKGAKLNIVDKLYEKLSNIGKKFSAIICPSIHQKSYEIDSSFLKNFLDEDKANERFFIDSIKSNHFMFDLPGYVKSKLEKLPIQNIYQINEDTYSTKLPDGSFKYPSYRRSCHTGEIYPRSLISTIMIKE